MIFAFIALLVVLVAIVLPLLAASEVVILHRRVTHMENRLERCCQNRRKANTPAPATPLRRPTARVDDPTINLRAVATAEHPAQRRNGHTRP